MKKCEDRQEISGLLTSALKRIMLEISIMFGSFPILTWSKYLVFKIEFLLYILIRRKQKKNQIIFKKHRGPYLNFLYGIHVKAVGSGMAFITVNCTLHELSLVFKLLCVSYYNVRGTLKVLLLLLLMRRLE